MAFSATQNRGEIYAKHGKNLMMTVLAEFRVGPTVFLKYFGGFTVSDTPS